MQGSGKKAGWGCSRKPEGQGMKLQALEALEKQQQDGSSQITIPEAAGAAAPPLVP